MTQRRFLALKSIIALLLLSFFWPVAGGTSAVAQEETAQMSASMNSYYYIPSDMAHLNVDLELPSEVMTDEISLEILIYPSATTRSYLSSFREGARRYPIARRTLEVIEPESEWTNKSYEISLSALGLTAGVYPYVVMITRGGEELASDYNFLVVMDLAGSYPLNLSLLWTLDFLPSTDALGNQLDGGLAAACSSSASDTGFLYALAMAMQKMPEVYTSMVFPDATYDNLKTLASTAEDGGEDSDQGAAEVLAALDGMLAGDSLDLLGTTYAFADPDLLTSQGWEEDAAAQMKLGLDSAKEIGSQGKGFVEPLFHLSDSTLQNMVETGIEYSVVGSEALEESAAGRRLLEGTTISQPVRFINTDGYLLKAFVRDETLYAYLEGTPQRDAAHMVQSIFADLAVLQREAPYVVRSCVLAFPPSFVPPQDFLNALYDAIKGCSWLQPRFLSELNSDQFPLEGVALQAPIYAEAPSQYTQKLARVKEDTDDFMSAIPEDHSLRDELERSVLIAENYRFTGDKDVAAAQAYLNSIDAVIQGETSKVKIEQKRSVTLSSTEGNLSVDITSDLDYPLTQVTLRLENASLTYLDPEGNPRQVNIEPRENRFIFSINTHRKGSFIVDIVLEANGLIIDSTSTTVNTSIINTLAIILLAGLAGIVILAIGSRRLLKRKRAGRHSRRRASK